MYRGISRSFVLPTGLMVLTLAIAMLVWHTARQAVWEHAGDRFTREATRATDKIQARLNTYEQVLRGGVGLFNTSASVTRKEWHRYISDLSLEEYFPGMQGIGYSEWAGDAAAVAKLEEKVRNNGYPGFHVAPVEPTRLDYTSIIYLEPFDERNRRAFGYDMYSESRRREAMDRAMDTGEPALSGKVELVQETSSDKQAGFLLYLPVYRKGSIPSSVQQRRRQLTGFVYSAFRADDLMQGILENADSGLAFQVYDGSPLNRNSLLYDGYAKLGLNETGRPPGFTTTREITIAGRRWIVRSMSTPLFETATTADAGAPGILMELLIGVLIGTIVLMSITTRRRVRERTLELQVLNGVNDQLQEATCVAEQANSAKSSFLAAMSHEMRTPMNGVVGMVEVLLNEAPRPQQAASLNVVMESATSLLSCIDDILDYSKIEGGDLELEETHEVLVDIVEDIVSSVVPCALSHNVGVFSFIDPELPTTVLVDSVRLRQILINLIGNAIKFSGSGEGGEGIVYVNVRPSTDDPNSIQFDVEDNGIGIEPETIDTIFDDFVQAESSTTRRFGGTGLGLAICKRLVLKMQGTISVSSHVSEGSVFSVILALQPIEPDNVCPFEDLSDISCILTSPGHMSAERLGKYLLASGAHVVTTPGADGEPGESGAGSHRVVMIDIDTEVGIDPVTVTGKHATGNARVRLQHGSGVEKSGLPVALSTDPGYEGVRRDICLQLEGLRRRDLVAAVALAAGKVAPVQSNLPMCALPELDRTPLSIEDARATGSLILVAEDDAINRKVLNKQLSLLGLTAEYAVNGMVALNLWRQNTYGLLITDLHMPVMDGNELVATIRREETAGTRLPIIVLSATAARDPATLALKPSVDRFLAKPIRLNFLADAILALSEQYTSYAVSPEKPLPSAQNSSAVAVQAINDPVFDPEVLRNLVGDDRDIEVELQKEFLTQLNDASDELMSAIATNTKPVAASIAHRLISTSRSIGAMKLGSDCAALQAACNDDSYSLTSDDARAIGDTLLETRTAIAVAGSTGSYP